MPHIFSPSGDNLCLELSKCLFLLKQSSLLFGVIFFFYQTWTIRCCFALPRHVFPISAPLLFFLDLKMEENVLLLAW